MDKIMTARKAILDDLKRRFKEGDKSVLPLNSNDEHRWHKPQDNYYSGQGVIKCPACQIGKLKYRRSSYNGHISAGCSNTECGTFWME